MSYKAPVDRKTQERTKAGWQSLLWMFVGAVIAVMIGVFLYLSPLFDGFRKEVEPNTPAEVTPLPTPTEKKGEYEFYEILPERKFQGSGSGLGTAPEPQTTEAEQPKRKYDVDAVVVAPKSANDEITVVEEDATYDEADPATGNDTATQSGTSDRQGEIKVSKSNSTYILQVRSYDNADDADRKLAEVIMAGVDAHVVQRQDASGVELYQVISQPMNSKAAAYAAEQKLSEYGIDSIVVEQRH